MAVAIAPASPIATQVTRPVMVAAAAPTVTAEAVLIRVVGVVDRYATAHPIRIRVAVLIQADVVVLDTDTSAFK
jgi:hypothetical protein